MELIRCNTTTSVSVSRNMSQGPYFEELCESSSLAVLARPQGAMAVHCLRFSDVSTCPKGKQQQVIDFEELCEANHVGSLCESTALAVIYRLRGAWAFYWLKLGDTKVKWHFNCCKVRRVYVSQKEDTTSEPMLRDYAHHWLDVFSFAFQLATDFKHAPTTMPRNTCTSSTMSASNPHFLMYTINARIRSIV